MKSLYPPGPANVPRDYTRLTSRYRWEVALVLASLLLSFVLYLAMLTGAAWLCRWLVIYPWPPRAEGAYVFVRVVGIVCSGLLFLYLLKGLFKGARTDESLLLEINEDEQPELFDFIRRICAETGAPLPRRVYLSPEVNAAVFYQSSLLSLVLPTPKHLLIGLGLVNMLNLSEFKAVLAHEFGHFSQKSMKVNSYVYVANKVLSDIIYGRDFLDDALNSVKNWDLRIAIFAWIFLGILWGLRKVLEGLFKVINIFKLSLMRQMEFNADRVAVSVAGSDAVVHALLRSGFADQSFRQLGSDLWTAADHQLYSRDIFHHLTPAADFLRRRARNPRLGLPPDELGPDVEVFQGGEGELGIPLMWSTHPSNRDREHHAKEQYLAAELDERSPWLLFRDLAQVRFQVSKRYYNVAHKVEQPLHFTDAATVQAFLDDEYAETTYPEHYHGFYDNRYLEIDLQPLLAQAGHDNVPTEATVRKLRATFGPDLAAWVKEHWQRLDEMNLLSGLQSGQLALKNKTLEFRGQNHPPSAVPALLERVGRELETDRNYKARIDAEVFLAYQRLAREADFLLGQQLVDRYNFHLGIQHMHQLVVQATQETQAALNFASGQREMSADGFAYVRDMLRRAVQNLHDILDRSKRYSIPALKNIDEGEPLRRFLLQKPVVADLSPTQTSIDPTWIQPFLNQLAEVQDRLKRLLFKSLGGILAAQEQILIVHPSEES